jgi:hypothetical protein
MASLGNSEECLYVLTGFFVFNTHFSPVKNDIFLDPAFPCETGQVFDDDRVAAVGHDIGYHRVHLRPVFLVLCPADLFPVDLLDPVLGDAANLLDGLQLAIKAVPKSCSFAETRRYAYAFECLPSLVNAFADAWG